MNYKHLSWKEMFQNYPNTLSNVFFVLIFSILYFAFKRPFTLFFLGYGLGNMIVWYSCETLHNANYRKRMADNILEQIAKEHHEQMRKIIKELEQTHTNSVVAEAERIKKFTP